MSKNNWAVYSWLFFGGADKMVESGLTKEEAEKKAEEYQKSNGDNHYSGYYVEQEGQKNTK